jgi:hypothetical protein
VAATSCTIGCFAATWSGRRASGRGDRVLLAHRGSTRGPKGGESRRSAHRHAQSANGLMVRRQRGRVPRCLPWDLSTALALTLEGQRDGQLPAAVARGSRTCASRVPPLCVRRSVLWRKRAGHLVGGSLRPAQPRDGPQPEVPAISVLVDMRSGTARPETVRCDRG